MPNPLAQRPVGVGRRFLGGHDGVVRVPEQGGSFACRRENRLQRGGVGDLAVRLDDHLDAAALRVRGELAQARGHAIDQRRLRLVGQVLVPEHADVRGLQLRREIDEAAALVQLTADARPARGRWSWADEPRQATRRFRARRSATVAATPRAELGALRQIHLALETAQLHGGVALAHGDIEDGAQGPVRAPERGEADWQLGGLRGPCPDHGRRDRAARRGTGRSGGG